MQLEPVQQVKFTALPQVTPQSTSRSGDTVRHRMLLTQEGRQQLREFKELDVGRAPLVAPRSRDEKAPNGDDAQNLAPCPQRDPVLPSQHGRAGVSGRLHCCRAKDTKLGAAVRRGSRRAAAVYYTVNPRRRPTQSVPGTHTSLSLPKDRL